MVGGGFVNQIIKVSGRLGFPAVGIHLWRNLKGIGLFKRILFLVVYLHNCKKTLFIIIFIPMSGFLKSFSIRSNPIIPHFQLNLPFSRKNLDMCLQAVNGLRFKSTPTVFVSINGITQNPQGCQLLYDAFKLTAERERIKVCAFLEERITALSYYVACSATYISANPFCTIGDLTTPHKSYLNLEKLFKYFGIEYERLGTKESLLWHSMKQPGQLEKDLTQKWLSLISENMKQTIKIRRNLKDQALQKLEGGLFNPKQALDLKLIDGIATMEEYKQLHYPGSKIRNYSFVPPRREPEFNKREVDVINEMVSLMEMPQGALLSIEDPINRWVENFIEVFSARLQDPESLADLDRLAGNIIAQMQVKMEKNSLMF